MFSRKYPRFGAASSSASAPGDSGFRLRGDLGDGARAQRPRRQPRPPERGGAGSPRRPTRELLGFREILLRWNVVGEGGVELVAEAVGKNRVVGSRFPSVSLWDWEVLVGWLRVTPGASGPPLGVTCSAPFLGTEALGHSACQLGEVAKLCGFDEGALDAQGLRSRATSAPRAGSRGGLVTTGKPASSLEYPSEARSILGMAASGPCGGTRRKSAISPQTPARWGTERCGSSARPPRNACAQATSDHIAPTAANRLNRLEVPSSNLGDDCACRKFGASTDGNTREPAAGRTEHRCGIGAPAGTVGTRAGESGSWGSSPCPAASETPREGRFALRGAKTLVTVHVSVS